MKVRVYLYSCTDNIQSSISKKDSLWLQQHLISYNLWNFWFLLPPWNYIYMITMIYIKLLVNVNSIWMIPSILSISESRWKNLIILSIFKKHFEIWELMISLIKNETLKKEIFKGVILRHLNLSKSFY